MSNFRTSRLLGPLGFLLITTVAAGCSRSSAGPTGPSATSLAVTDPPPLILPYTGGPTSGGNSATIQAVRQEQIEGRIEGFPPVVSNSFLVDGQLILTNAGTSYRLGSRSGSFADLAVGRRVHVTGQPVAGGTLATLVRIQNTNTALPVNLNGVLTQLSGDASSFVFVIDGREVRGNSATGFLGGSTFADLGEGVGVNVKGLQQDGFVSAESIHVTGDGDDVTSSDSPGDDPGGDVGSTETEPTPLPPPPTPVVAFNPDPIQGLAQCQSYTCGFAFTVLADVTVQALGQWDENLDGLSTDASVGLWSSDGALLASVIVPIGTAATMTSGYRFVTITPVQLIAGRQYVIGSAFRGGGAPVFLAPGLDPALSSPMGGVILKGAGVLAFPASPTTRLYGGGNFLIVPHTP
jgi:hypothetical protein